MTRVDEPYHIHTCSCIAGPFPPLILLQYSTRGWVRGAITTPHRTTPHHTTPHRTAPHTTIQPIHRHTTGSQTKASSLSKALTKHTKDQVEVLCKPMREPPRGEIRGGYGNYEPHIHYSARSAYNTNSGKVTGIAASLQSLAMSMRCSATRKAHQMRGKL